MDKHIMPLAKSQCYVDGKWIGEPSLPVLNKANGLEIGKVPDFGGAETRAAIEAAHVAFGTWSKLLAKERSVLLKRWNDLIIEHADELALLLSKEQGKPIAEARGEVIYGAAFIEFYAEEAKRISGETIPSHKADARIVVIKQPIGVVGAITPWNFPNAMITRKVAPALAAGCSVVIKPAEDTPLSALALAELASRAGIPKGVINVITCKNPEPVGTELTTNPLVRLITFTGSTAVGRILYRQCAGTIKKLGLELGGNSPFIVFDDADLDKAIAGLMASKYRNSGQTCVCANRILVQNGVYDKFTELLVAQVKKLKLGEGTQEGVTQGPLINLKAIEKVEDHVSDAVAKGATVVLGGKRHELGGTFYEPTILTGVTPDMKVSNEETFGPVAPLYRFETEEEAVQMANDTESGLAAYFYSRDIGRVWRVGEALEYGIIGINEGIISTEVAPFGGVKESGLGREGSQHGIEEFVELKYMLMGGL